MSDPLIIAGREFGSRLFLGTAGYPNRKLMIDSIAASGTEMVTASIRRISLAGEDESLVDVIPKHVHFLPNTAGCQTAKDAVLTAERAQISSIKCGLQMPSPEPIGAPSGITAAAPVSASLRQTTGSSVQ